MCLLAQGLELVELALDLGVDVERLPAHADAPGVRRLDELADLGDELRVRAQAGRGPRSAASRRSSSASTSSGCSPRCPWR